MLNSWLLLLIFSFFPLGQLPGLALERYFGLPFTVHPFELLILGYNLSNYSDIVRLKRFNFYNFSLFAVFSLLLSLAFLPKLAVLKGSLYLVRFVSIMLFLQIIKRGKELLNRLLVISFAVAVFGLIQYYFIPDLRQLKILGWDNHYYRLVSTFLDPAFTGLIIGMGIMLNLHLIFKKYSHYLLLSLFVLLISLLLTYSRSSYLAVLLAFGYTLRNFKKLIMLAVVLFLTSLLILPKPGGEGVNLARVSSIIAKGEDYTRSIKIIKKSPVFGVGFNNICAVRGESELNKNACSGLDNSFLFVWATTGIVGLIAFLYDWGNLLKASVPKTKSVLYACTLVLVAHTQFTNSFFYIFILFWYGVLLKASVKLK